MACLRTQADEWVSKTRGIQISLQLESVSSCKSTMVQEEKHVSQKCQRSESATAKQLQTSWSSSSPMVLQKPTRLQGTPPLTRRQISYPYPIQSISGILKHGSMWMATSLGSNLSAVQLRTQRNGAASQIAVTVTQTLYCKTTQTGQITKACQAVTIG